MHKDFTGFSGILINKTLLLLLTFLENCFSHLQKCLTIHQLNIIKVTKEDYKNSLVKDIKVFLKKKKKKSGNIGMNDTKISLRIKSKGWLSIEKNITESKKMFQYD